MSGVQTFADFVREVETRRPEVALVLGSGLGHLVERCRILRRLPFLEVPGLATTSVIGHKCALTLADWAGKRILVFEGRLHFYEGHPWLSVVEPVRIAHSLGARILLLTNAAGGIRDDLVPGSLMALSDHVEWTRPYCWRCPGPGACGPERPSPYSSHLRELISQTARELSVPQRPGIYASVTGPCYETPAEIRALKSWGADAVGMSTAREAQHAFELGMECAALSLITNRAAGLSPGPIQHEDVLRMGSAKEIHLGQVIEEFIRRL
jgi:purine-nucleoside phosphorylase